MSESPTEEPSNDEILSTLRRGIVVTANAATKAASETTVGGAEAAQQLASAAHELAQAFAALGVRINVDA